ncbi:MAG: GldG family protein, partial [Treponema sp.]|nr:GldG family protein [Treponema sp.]
MTRRQTDALTFLALLAFFLALLASGRLGLRFDLTRDRAYTLSPVSRNLYTEIEDEVRITYYVSGRLRAASPVPRTIEDMLAEYAVSSHGRITLAVRDPAGTNLTEHVEAMGIRPRRMEITEKDGLALAAVYTGIVIEYLEKAEVIPVVFSLDSLEYDVTSRIRSLVRDRERSAGIIIGDSSRSRDGDYGFAAEAIFRSGFRVLWLEAGGEIPENLSVLLVLGGAGELDEWALYHIDRYVRAGGKALFALEGVELDRESLEARKVHDQGLLAMIASYGAEVREALVLDRPALRTLPYPHWIGIQASAGRTDHPVTARFEGADLFWSSPMELAAPEGVEAVPLFTTTPGARIMDGDFVTGFDAPSLYEEYEGEGGGTQIMAAALSG